MGLLSRLDFAVIVALSLVVLAVYGQVLHHEFVNFDDDQYVYANGRVTQGLTRDGIVWAFSTLSMGNWSPLTWLSHMLDCQLFGLNAGLHHLDSVLIHLASSILLYVALRAMTGAIGRSAVVASLFALHPLRVESVAWVAERKDVLSTFFFMITLWVYYRYATRPTPWRYTAVFSSLALGLMAKPMLVTTPFVLLLLDVWPLGRFGTGRARPAGERGPNDRRAGGGLGVGRLVAEKIPLFVLAAAASIVTFIGQRREGATYLAEAVPLGGRVAGALVNYVTYLRLLFWPAHLAVLYPYHGVPSTWHWLAVLAFLAAISIVVVRSRREQPYLAVGWGWYVGTLVPVVGFVPVGGASTADRFTYIPSIGLLVLVVWSLAALAAGRRGRVVLLATVAGAAIVSCMTLTWRQLRTWHDGITLYERALAVTRDNFVARVNLAAVLVQRGRLDEAVAQYREALQIQPPISLKSRGAQVPQGYVLARANLGLALASLGRLDEAIAVDEEGLRLSPASAPLHSNLSMALLRLGRTPEALVHAREALRLDPKDPRPYNNLAWILATHPDPKYRNGAEAVQLAARACALWSYRDAGGLDTLAAAYAEAGRMPDAVSTTRRAIALASATGAGAAVQEFEQRLRGYIAGRPCRDAGIPSPGVADSPMPATAVQGSLATPRTSAGDRPTDQQVTGTR